jgi:DNA-binding MarR family transcriptional regulator
MDSSPKPAGYLDRRIGYRLKVAEHAQRRLMDVALSEHGLTVPQYAALSILADHPGASNAELARRSFVTPQTMTDILRALHRDGLVTRAPHPAHGRILQYTIAAAGERARRRADASVMEIERRMLAGLSANDHRALHELLGRCIDALRGDSTGE